MQAQRRLPLKGVRRTSWASHADQPAIMCLTHRFNISAPYHHDITLASGALQNVVSNGTGTDLVIDLHR